AYDIGKHAGLHYVYLGNVGKGNNTYCSQCQRLLIGRLGFSIESYHVIGGRCPDCSRSIDGVGM
ncbi:MAG TPA: radical SAM protein, partial [Thermodesulfobacteriota bacterium]|nr:radical SAM protein [Thermodesulfobacteriota bacterium]